MEAERRGSKYTKACRECSRTFWTDNKCVVFCSRACYYKGRAKQSKESLKRYRNQPHVKKSIAESSKRRRLEVKKNRLASDINAYFTFLHSGKTSSKEIVPNKIKKGLRR